MDQEQSRWRTIGRWVIWSGSVLVALALVLGLVFSIYGGYRHGWEWTGIVTDPPYPKRTLWDWLQLLIIPAVLAGGGLWFNRQQRAQELQTADRRAQDETLQAYLDQMSNLLAPNNDQPSLYDERPPDSLRSVARARTLTVLPRLDGDRKARVVQFLYESALIVRERPVLDLSGADLSEANLREAVLSDADLTETNLRDADLFKADMSEVILSETNLRRADLSDTEGITNEELEQQAVSFEGATMPNGQKYEEWLKDREKRQQDE